MRTAVGAVTFMGVLVGVGVFVSVFEGLGVFEGVSVFVGVPVWPWWLPLSLQTLPITSQLQSPLGTVMVPNVTQSVLGNIQ